MKHPALALRPCPAASLLQDRQQRIAIATFARCFYLTHIALQRYGLLIAIANNGCVFQVDRQVQLARSSTQMNRTLVGVGLHLQDLHAGASSAGKRLA
ncbi:hypothetical protein [Pseudomonas sp. LP_7_YM]|uniref:hypothetical protein n=1 Tax=Pseudomonas sp. LP_7_YM TaxID=2485137 RepID=UPI001060CA64|nr:hypothetical protein [Pseudomonas sp. LP_7_YM]